jgi:hypothetical protein
VGMTLLAQLALQRANVPSFPGATLPERLLAGRLAAETILKQYVPQLSYDQAEADQVLAKIGVWQERNQTQLESVFMDPNAAKLPQQICLAFGADVARQFILAGFTRAAIGIGPWLSGRVAAEAASGTRIQPRWAEEDAEMRLQMFGAIVKMEQDGYLRHLFIPPADLATKQEECGVSGLGGGDGFGVAPVVVWAIALVVVAVVALFLLYYYSANRLRDNNRLMADLCQKAQEQGDKETVAQCIAASADLQKESPIPGLAELGKGLGTAAVVAAVVYIGLKMVPGLLESRARRKAGAT